MKKKTRNQDSNPNRYYMDTTRKLDMKLEIKENNVNEGQPQEKKSSNDDNKADKAQSYFCPSVCLEF